jgi:zinc protease
MRTALIVLPLLAAALPSAAQPQPAAPPVKHVAAVEPSPRSLKYPPLREVKIPEVTRFTLPNGMKLYLLENHELPLVNGFALVRTGNLFDPPTKVGLAEVTGAVMRTGGTATRTGDELDALLENMAASVESSIGETSGRVSFSCLSENTAEALDVFKDILTAPEFRQDKIDLAKTQLRGSVARRNDDADGVASREFAGTLYGKDNAYGWQLDYEHIDNITREDLRGFYSRYFFPRNIMLAVYGDFKTEEMRALLEKLFVQWKPEQPSVPAFPQVRERPAHGVFVAEKSDVAQTFFRMGHLGGMFRDKDYPALAVMGDILGGSFRSRLVQRVRTQLGYAYDISAAWAAAYDHPGMLIISGSTKSPTTTEALEAIREEIRKIRTVEVSDEELRVAKDTVLNSFVFNFDSPGRTLTRMINYEYFGYPADFIFQYQKAVAAVTKADILRVAKQYIRPGDFTVIAVGKPAEFGRPLSSLGMEIKAIDLTIPPGRAQ